MRPEVLFNYLNNLSDEEFDQWLEHASDEQLDIADKMFDSAKNEKQIFETVSDDLSVAKNYLKKFTLGA